MKRANASQPERVLIFLHGAVVLADLLRLYIQPALRQPPLHSGKRAGGVS